MTSPSQWQDGRDAGHDELVYEVFTLLRERPNDDVVKSKGDRKDAPITRVTLEMEYMFVNKNGQVLGFGDIVERWHCAELRVMHYRVYEVKPRIISIGSLMRQCKATRQMVRNATGDRQDDLAVSCQVIAAVRANDPAFPLFKKMYDGPFCTNEEGPP